MWVLLLYIGLMLFIAYQIAQNRSEIHPIYASLLWILKVSAALFAGVYYFKFYQNGGDTWQHFELATQVLSRSSLDILYFYFDSSEEIQYSPKTLVFVKMLIPLVWLSWKNYWLCAALISSLSFLTFYLVYIHFVINSIEYPSHIILSFFIFPSVIVWNSGIFKETMALMLVLIILIPYLAFLKSRNYKDISAWSLFFSIIAFWLFFELRFFLAVILIPALGFAIISDFNMASKFKILGFMAISVFLLGILWLHPVLNLNELPYYIFQSHSKILSASNQSLDMHYDFNQGNWPGVLDNIMRALQNAFLRPFPWEWQSAEYVINGLENYVLLGMLALFFYHFKSIKLKEIILLAILLVGIGLISLATPNFGTLFRYKSVFLPFFSIILLYRRPLRTRLGGFS